MGELDGQYRADDIRGSYTFGGISNLYGVPLEALAKAFRVDESKAEAFQMKSLTDIFPMKQLKSEQAP